jgi:two-component system OmpR family response regulator
MAGPRGPLTPAVADGNEARRSRLGDGRRTVARDGRLPLKLIAWRGIVIAMDTVPVPTRPDGLPPPRVLVVEHPTALAATFAATLTAAGMEVEIAASLMEAQHRRDRFHSGIVLLHLAGSPPVGLEGIALLARGGDRAVIVLLEADLDSARIAVLDGGADDVVGVRVQPGELAARIRAVHRRLSWPQAGFRAEPRGTILLDPAHRCLVGLPGDRIPLSEAEFVALETLLDADGAPVSRDWLGRAALKRPLHPEDRSVDQLVLKLRRKLAAAGAPERTILSARRQGYVIADTSRFVSLDTSPAPLPPLRPLARAIG